MGGRRDRGPLRRHHRRLGGQQRARVGAPGDLDGAQAGAGGRRRRARRPLGDVARLPRRAPRGEPRHPPRRHARGPPDPGRGAGRARSVPAVVRPRLHQPRGPQGGGRARPVRGHAGFPVPPAVPRAARGGVRALRDTEPLADRGRGRYVRGHHEDDRREDPVPGRARLAAGGGLRPLGARARP